MLLQTQAFSLSVYISIDDICTRMYNHFSCIAHNLYCIINRFVFVIRDRGNTRLLLELSYIRVTSDPKPVILGQQLLKSFQFMLRLSVLILLCIIHTNPGSHH